MDGKISNLQQIASIRRYKYTDGIERDLEVLDCDNGNIRFLLNVTKALDVMQIYHKGQNVSFISKNGFTAREVGFLNRFEGGMLYTCGLDYVGAKDGKDMHGEFHNIPATVTRNECTEDGIVVEAVIRDTELFGKDLTFKRRVYSALGSDTVTVEDTLINDGYKAEEYAILYHVNIGYPILDEGARVEADVKECYPRTDWSRQMMGEREYITDAVPNQFENCFFMKLNTKKAALINEKLGKKFTLEYTGEVLDKFLQWKSMGSGDYALGFEPATTFIDDKFECKTINPGEEIKITLAMSVSEI